MIPPWTVAQRVEAGGMPALLNEPSLLRHQAFWGGQWRDSVTGNSIEVSDPARRSCLGSVPNVSGAEAADAVAAAAVAFERWRRTLPQERAFILGRWAALMEEHAQDLAMIMTFEQGKPLKECQGEIVYAASYLRWFAEEARRIRGEGVASHLSGRQTFVSRVPAGVAACITPWNFPSAMVTRKAGAALAAGCSVVVKPAPETPFSALALAVLSEWAGLPAGVFSVLTGDAVPIAEAFTQSEKVRVLSFTGSTRVGRLLAQMCAPTVKRMSLELGGHAPFIVFADANLEQAANDAVAAKFQTSGQDCLAANRILVEQSAYPEFCNRFVELVSQLKVGFGTDQEVDIGPLINSQAVDRCLAQVADAEARGARVAVGGAAHSLGGNFMSPTVLLDCAPGMRIWHEETFGPVAAVGTFSSEKEAIQIANDTEMGLAAYVYTESGKKSLRVSDQLDFGMVAINTAQFTGAPIPFGGMKQSGIGREGSSFGVEDFMEVKYRCFAA